MYNMTINNFDLVTSFNHFLKVGFMGPVGAKPNPSYREVIIVY